MKFLSGDQEATMRDLLEKRNWRKRFLVTESTDIEIDPKMPLYIHTTSLKGLREGLE